MAGLAALAGARVSLVCHAQTKLFSNVPCTVGVGVKEKSSAEGRLAVLFEQTGRAFKEIISGNCAPRLVHQELAIWQRELPTRLSIRFGTRTPSSMSCTLKLFA